jgi:hypothetical protein
LPRNAESWWEEGKNSSQFYDSFKQTNYSQLGKQTNKNFTIPTRVLVQRYFLQAMAINYP